MSKFNFVGPYNKNDSTIGHLSTPFTSSKFVETYLSSLPVYREILLPCYFRGLEVGMAHGYFLIGPFYKLGPLRNSEIALIAGYLATIGLIIILSLALALYGKVYYGNINKSTKIYSPSINVNPYVNNDKIEKIWGVNELNSYKGWMNFTGGFLIGALGGSGFAFTLLS